MRRISTSSISYGIYDLIFKTYCGKPITLISLSVELILYLFLRTRFLEKDELERDQELVED